MGTLAAGILVLVAGILITMAGTVVPLVLGTSKEMWHPKVGVGVSLGGLAIMIMGAGIMIYAALTLPLH